MMGSKVLIDSLLVYNGVLWLVFAVYIIPACIMGGGGVVVKLLMCVLRTRSSLYETEWGYIVLLQFLR